MQTASDFDRFLDSAEGEKSHQTQTAFREDNSKLDVPRYLDDHCVELLKEKPHRTAGPSTACGHAFSIPTTGRTKLPLSRALKGS